MNKKGLKEKIINTILDILIGIFTLILLISIYNGIQTKIFGNSYSSFYGYSFFEIQTGSMEPVISAGDWIIVKNKNKYKLNDIITYQQDENFITHRIVETYKGTYITQGDDNNTKDEGSISKEQIIGEVVKILPGFGILKKTVFNPIVLMFIIIAIYLISTLNSKTKLKFKGLKNVINDLKNKKDEFDFIDLDDKVIVNNKNDKSMEIDNNKKLLNSLIEENGNDLNEKIDIVENKNNEETFTIIDINNSKEDEIEIKDDLKFKPDYQEDDLDKTVFFRAVSVNKYEINDTLLKAAEFNIEESVNAPKIIDDEILEDDDETVKANLELLEGNKTKKFKTLFDRIVFLKKSELNELLNIITNNEKALSNEPTIKEKFIDLYFDAKYYNFCGDINTEYTNKNKISKLEEVLKEYGNELISSYKGTDKKYADKVKKYIELFILVLNIEHGNDTISDLNSKKEFYRKKLIIYSKNKNLNAERIDHIIDGIAKTQRIYVNMINYSLKKLDTNMFELVFNKIITKPNLMGVSLKHNITFSKVYSDYIIDRTYTEGIIAEDKIIILLNLLSIELVKNMFNCDFTKKYLLYLPDTIYKKDNKLNKVETILNNEFVKNNVTILIKYSVLIKNKKVISRLKKSGLNFDIVFTNNVEIKEKDASYLYLTEKIFMDKKVIDTKTLLNSIPKELINNIVYIDLLDKFDDLGGDN